MHKKNAVVVTVTTGNVSPIHLNTLLGMEESHEGGPRVRQPPKKWSAITEILRNTDLASTI